MDRFKYLFKMPQQTDYHRFKELQATMNVIMCGLADTLSREINPGHI